MEHTQDQVRPLIRHHLGDYPSSVQRIATGLFNASYAADLPDGRRVVIRIAPPDDAVYCFYEYRMMRQEPAIHRMLRARTDAPVAEVLAADFTRELIDRDFLIMDRLSGEPLDGRLGPAARAGVLEQVGRFLRQAHDITADRYGYLGEHRPMEPAATWPEAFAVMWHRLIDDVVGVEGYTPPEADRFRRLLDRYAPALARPVESRFLHMDVWDQNILVDDSARVTGLVDWDRALWGDAEIEFAVLDYCGISEPAFWVGYGRPDDSDPRAGDGDAAARRLLYLLYEMQKYIVIRKGRQGDAARAERHKRACLRLADSMP